MADIIPGGKIDIYDIVTVCGRYGGHGEYSTNLTDVMVMFIFPDESYTIKQLDADGFVDIPGNADRWRVYKGVSIIGALVTFW
jgi:hypothetical protein